MQHTGSFENEEYYSYFARFTSGIFGHVMRLDQPREKKYVYGLQTRLFAPFFC